MSRGLSGALLAAFSDEHVVTVILVELGFDSGTQRYHSGIGNLTYLGDTYTGVGDLGNIEPILEDSGIQMKGLRIALQGVDTTVVDLTVNEPIQGRPVAVHLASYDYDTASISDGFEIFSGYMDTMELQRGENASLILSVESIMSQFDLANIRRFTSEDHKERYPTDNFFDLMPQLNEVQITWGAHIATPNTHSDNSDTDSCVWVGAFMPNTKKAGEVVVGDSVVILNDDQDGTIAGDINKITYSIQPCVTLTTKSGITLTCSTTAPLVLKGSSEYVKAPDALGILVPILDNDKFSWEPIVKVDLAGDLEVAHIKCHDQIYAAGNEKDRYILTHNK